VAAGASISVEARAKWNLTLDVLGLRSDGYHELASVMQSLALSDTLIVTVTPLGGTQVCGDSPEVPQGTENLVYHAIEALRRLVGFHQGVQVEIHKRIPMTAGLGGGSSDAAAAMLAANYLLELGLTTGQLLAAGAAVGSDVPFCLVGGTALARGRGERLALLPSPPMLWLALARPRLEMATAGIYAAWDRLRPRQLPASGRMLAALDSGKRDRIVTALANNLEAVVWELYPEVAFLRAKLLDWGAEKALLCGSGPTVAAVVPTEEAARNLIIQAQDAGYETWLTHTVV
jgi:4-diphosphocytidyl-2-C-methyl-D-erythritol kinase